MHPAPPAPSPGAPLRPTRLRLDLTVRRHGLHLVVGGTLDRTQLPRFARAVELLAQSPRPSTLDLSGVTVVAPGTLTPLVELANSRAAAAGPPVRVVAVGPAVHQAADLLGLPVTAPFDVVAWASGPR